MIDPKDCTIIIPHLGGTKETEGSLNECYNSLRETAPDMPKLIAVNGDKCWKPYHKNDYGGWDSIFLNQQGQCRAVNAAVAMTNTPWIFVTNDDMIYAPNWWGRLTSDITWQPCVSPKLVEPRKGAPIFDVFFAGGAGGDFNYELWKGYAQDYYEHTFKMRTGFNLPFLITRKLWDTIGGYDINYDPWGSNGDSDLEYKIKLAGVQPMQNCNCIVYHFSQTSGTFEPRNQSHWQKNWDYFIEKWGFDRTDDGIWEATFEIPAENKFHPDWEGKYGN